MNNDNAEFITKNKEFLAMNCINKSEVRKVEVKPQQQSSESLYRMANRYHRNNNIADAIYTFKQIQDRWPNSSEAENSQSKLIYFNNNYHDVYEKVINGINPKVEALCSLLQISKYTEDSTIISLYEETIRLWEPNKYLLEPDKYFNAQQVVEQLKKAYSDAEAFLNTVDTKTVVTNLINANTSSSVFTDKPINKVGYEQDGPFNAKYDDNNADICIDNGSNDQQQQQQQLSLSSLFFGSFPMGIVLTFIILKMSENQLSNGNAGLYVTLTLLINVIAIFYVASNFRGRFFRAWICLCLGYNFGSIIGFFSFVLNLN